MNALVLSGGGSKGAYAVGALQHLLIDLNRKYDILCGVSSGAVNVAFLSMFANGKSSAQELFKIWKNIKTSNIYKSWKPFGKLQSIINKSFYDSTPLQNLIKNNLDLTTIRNNNKIVNVGTVSLSSGKYTNFNQSSDHFINAVIASASFPVMFQPIYFDNQWWSDGGIKCISPLHTAIDLGATEIDLIITSPEKRIPKFIKTPNIIDILKRSLDLGTDKIMENDLEKLHMNNLLAFNGFKKNIKLNLIRPKFNLIEDLLDFDSYKINKMIDLGYNDAINIIECPKHQL